MELERDLIIGVLKHHGINACAGAGLAPGDLVTPLYRKLYKYAVEIHNAGNVVGLDSIQDRCSRNGGLNQGEERELLRLVNLDTDISVVDAARALKDKAERVRLAYKLQEIAGGLVKGAGLITSIDAVKAELDKRVARQIQSMTPEEADAEAISYYQKDTITTGFQRLDAMLAGGMRSGEMMVVGGRPGTGKSLFVLTLLAQAAAAGCKAAMISLEMSPASLQLRLVSRESQTPHTALRQNLSRLMNTERVKTAREKLSKLPLKYIDSSSIYQDITTEIEALSAVGNRIIGIDYVQLIHCKGFSGNRSAELTEITSGLKALARRLGICLILAAQLRRPHPQAKDRPPELDDLKDSGSIEQDGDVVLLLWEDSSFSDAASDTRFIRALIRKNRNGEALKYISYDFRAQFLDLRECPIGGRHD